MREDLLDILACPHDATFPLETVGGAGSPTGVAELACPTCGRRFPVVAGIPSFLELSDDAFAAIQRQEIEARDRGYRPRDEPLREPHERLAETDAVRTALGDCAGMVTLDAGCGLGELTHLFAAARRVVAVDYSREGLNHFYAFDGPPPGLVHASVAEMPFRAQTFDRIMSTQVLEHLPAPGLRNGFLDELARVLRPGGRLVLTVYNWHEGRRARGIPKEGFHPSGIFYHCYEPAELRAALAQRFSVEALWGVGVLLPFTYRLTRHLGARIVYWDRLWRARRVALQHGEVLLAVCNSKR